MNKHGAVAPTSLQQAAVKPYTFNKNAPSLEGSSSDGPGPDLPISTLVLDYVSAKQLPPHRSDCDLSEHGWARRDLGQCIKKPAPRADRQRPAGGCREPGLHAAAHAPRAPRAAPGPSRGRGGAGRERRSPAPPRRLGARCRLGHPRLSPRPEVCSGICPDVVVN